MAIMERTLQEEPAQRQKQLLELPAAPGKPANVNVTVINGVVSLSMNGNPPAGFSVSGSEIHVKPGQYAVTFNLANVDFGPLGYVTYPSLEPGFGAGDQKTALAYLPVTAKVVSFMILNNLVEGDLPRKARTDLDTFIPGPSGTLTRIVLQDPTIVYEPPGG